MMATVFPGMAMGASTGAAAAATRGGGKGAVEEEDFIEETDEIIRQVG
jgi:hypothetical protein